MAKRLTEKQKEEITKLFNAGINIYDLSKKFYCTELTISRNLKKKLGDAKYKELTLKNKSKIRFIDKKEKINNSSIAKIESDLKNENNSNEEIGDVIKRSEFIEITPLNLDIDNFPHNNLTSLSISDVTFPKTVFMIVDKNFELDIKYLKYYPKWQFLSEDELKRKSIEIYFELKTAKDFCGKEQKVIKVPNTDVFRIVAPILLSKGISRIISSDTLIAL